MRIPEFDAGDTGGSTSGSTGSSGGTTTTTSAPSKPAGPSEAEIAARRNMENAFKAMLQAWGLALTPNLQKLIQQAIGQKWNATTFTFYLRKTPEYRQEFPGNQNKDGTLNLSEAAYIARVGQYRDAAAQIGMKVTPAVIKILVKKNISPSLFATRARAVKALRTNKDVFQNFAEYLDAKGLGPKGGIKKADMLKFAMRQGPKRWEMEWQNAYTSAQLQAAGIDVGRPRDDSDLSYKQLTSIIRRFEAFNPGAEVEKLGAGDYAALAEQVQTVLPLSALYREGLSKKDLVELQFGGKNAAGIASRVKRVLATHEAFATEQRATPQLTQGPRGSQLRTGQVPQQATE